MNLLRLLHEAARRCQFKIDTTAPASTNVDNRNLTIPDDPDLEDRIRHGLKRGMNRRELFKFSAIAAAVGVPAVRELILSPAKVIVVPPAPAVVTEWLPAGGASNSAAIAAQFEHVRPRLKTLMETNCNFLEALMADVEPHLGDMLHGRDAWLNLGYDPKAPYRRLVHTGETAEAAAGRLVVDCERMVGGLYVPDGQDLFAAATAGRSPADLSLEDFDDDDYWDDTPDSEEEEDEEA